MKILITGGTGLIGSKLIPTLLPEHDIVGLTRSVAAAEHKLGSDVKWVSSLSDLLDLNEFDAVINLAGEPIVAKRWSASQKQRLENSRWEITRKLTDLFNKSTQPPEVFISGSAIGYYGRQNAAPIDERFDKPHDEFSHQLCKKWESIALEAQSERTRVCILRTGIVLAKNEGALGKMELPFKLGLGGPIGAGDHYMSWIHINDMVAAIGLLLTQKNSSGIFNLTAPETVSNAVFSQCLAGALHRPCLLFTPKMALKLAMGEMADLLIHGQNVIPKHLLDLGFVFTHPKLDQALKHLYH